MSTPYKERLTLAEIKYKNKLNNRGINIDENNISALYNASKNNDTDTINNLITNQAKQEATKDSVTDNTLFNKGENSVEEFEYNLTNGLFDFFEGVGDFGAGIVGNVANAFGDKETGKNISSFIKYDWSSAAAKLSTDALHYIPNAISGDAQKENYWALDAENVQNYQSDLYNKGLWDNSNTVINTLHKGANELTTTVGNMLPSIALGFATGGASIGAMSANALSKLVSVGAMSLSAAGQGTQEAMGEGADIGAGTLYGLASGTVEGLTEYALGWLGKGGDAILGKFGLKTTKLAKLFPNTVSGVFAQNTGKSLLRHVAGEFVEEGTEEVLSDLANPLIKSIYNGKTVAQNYGDRNEFSIQGMAHSFIMGGLSTLVLGGKDIITRAKAGSNVNDILYTMQDKGIPLADEVSKLSSENKLYTLDENNKSVPTEQGAEVLKNLEDVQNEIKTKTENLSESEKTSLYNMISDYSLEKYGKVLDKRRAILEENINTISNTNAPNKNEQLSVFNQALDTINNEINNYNNDRIGFVKQRLNEYYDRIGEKHIHQDEINRLNKTLIDNNVTNLRLIVADTQEEYDKYAKNSNADVNNADTYALNIPNKNGEAYIVLNPSFKNDEFKTSIHEVSHNLQKDITEKMYNNIVNSSKTNDEISTIMKNAEENYFDSYKINKVLQYGKYLKRKSVSDYFNILTEKLSKKSYAEVNGSVDDYDRYSRLFDKEVENFKEDYTKEINAQFLENAVDTEQDFNDIIKGKMTKRLKNKLSAPMRDAIQEFLKIKNEYKNSDETIRAKSIAKKTNEIVVSKEETDKKLAEFYSNEKNFAKLKSPNKTTFDSMSGFDDNKYKLYESDKDTEGFIKEFGDILEGVGISPDSIKSDNDYDRVKIDGKVLARVTQYFTNNINIQNYKKIMNNVNSTYDIKLDLYNKNDKGELVKIDVNDNTDKVFEDAENKENSYVIRQKSREKLGLYNAMCKEINKATTINFKNLNSADKSRVYDLYYFLTKADGVNKVKNLVNKMNEFYDNNNKTSKKEIIDNNDFLTKLYKSKYIDDALVLDKNKLKSAGIDDETINSIQNRCAEIYEDNKIQRIITNSQDEQDPQLRSEKERKDIEYLTNEFIKRYEARTTNAAPKVEASNNTKTKAEVLNAETLIEIEKPITAEDLKKNRNYNYLKAKYMFSYKQYSSTINNLMEQALAFSSKFSNGEQNILDNQAYSDELDLILDKTRSLSNKAVNDIANFTDFVKDAVDFNIKDINDLKDNVFKISSKMTQAINQVEHLRAYLGNSKKNTDFDINQNSALIDEKIAKNNIDNIDFDDNYAKEKTNETYIQEFDNGNKNRLNLQGTGLYGQAFSEIRSNFSAFYEFLRYWSGTDSSGSNKDNLVNYIKENTRKLDEMYNVQTLKSAREIFSDVHDIVGVKAELKQVYEPKTQTNANNKTQNKVWIDKDRNYRMKVISGDSAVALLNEAHNSEVGDNSTLNKVLYNSTSMGDYMLKQKNNASNSKSYLIYDTNNQEYVMYSTQTFGANSDKVVIEDFVAPSNKSLSNSLALFSSYLTDNYGVKAIAIKGISVNEKTINNLEQINAIRRAGYDTKNSINISKSKNLMKYASKKNSLAMNDNITAHYFSYLPKQKSSTTNYGTINFAKYTKPFTNFSDAKNAALDASEQSIKEYGEEEKAQMFDKDMQKIINKAARKGIQIEIPTKEEMNALTPDEISKLNYKKSIFPRNILNEKKFLEWTNNSVIGKGITFETNAEDNGKSKALMSDDITTILDKMAESNTGNTDLKQIIDNRKAEIEKIKEDRYINRKYTPKDIGNIKPPSNVDLSNKVEVGENPYKVSAFNIIKNEKTPMSKAQTLFTAISQNEKLINTQIQLTDDKAGLMLALKQLGLEDHRERDAICQVLRNYRGKVADSIKNGYRYEKDNGDIAYTDSLQSAMDTVVDTASKMYSGTVRAGKEWETTKDNVKRDFSLLMYSKLGIDRNSVPSKTIMYHLYNDVENEFRSAELNSNKYTKNITEYLNTNEEIDKDKLFEAINKDIEVIKNDKLDDVVKNNLVNSLKTLKKSEYRDIKTVFGKYTDLDVINENKGNIKTLIQKYLPTLLDYIKDKGATLTERDFTDLVEKAKNDSMKTNVDYQDYEKKDIEKLGKYKVSEIRDMLNKLRSLPKELSNDFYRERIKEITSKYGEETVSNFVSTMRSWFDGQLIYAQQHGIIEQNEINKMQYLYPNYVPTNREVVESGSGSKKVIADTKSFTYPLKGSDLVINDLFSNAESYALKFVKNSTVNDVVQLMYEESIKNKAESPLVKFYKIGEIADDGSVSYNKPELSKLVPNTEIGKYITNGEIDENGVIKGNVLTSEMQDKNMIKFTSNVVSDDGKVVKEIIIAKMANQAFNAFYNVADYNYSAIENLPLITKALKGWNRIFKNLVTSWNPFFTIRNFSRDIMDALVTSVNINQNPLGVLNYVKEWALSAKQIWNNDNLYQMMLSTGQGASSFSFNDKSTNLESEAKVNTSQFLTKLKRFSFSNINELVEQATRFTEFKLSYNNYINSDDEFTRKNALMMASYDAAEVTTNFSRGGTLTKLVNSTLIPFLNAQVQGACKVVHFVVAPRKLKDWATLMVKLFLLGIAPQLIQEFLFANDEDYQALPEYTKETYFIVAHLPNGVFIKIPKGRISGTINSFARQVQNVANGEVQLGDAVNNFWGTAASNLSPVDMGTGIRTIFSPISDVAKNITWYGQSIDKSSDLNKRASSRYDSTTGTIAKTIGTMFNQSPKRVQYLLEQYSGIVGDFVLPMGAEQATDAANQVKLFIQNNTTIDAVKNSKYRGQFYDARQEALYGKNEGDAIASLKYNYLTRAMDDINELENKIDATTNDADRYTLYLTVRQAYKTAIENANELGTKLKNIDIGNDADKFTLTEAYRQAFGAEYALKYYSANTYDRATVTNKFGISYDTYYRAYFDLRGMTTKEQRIKYINSIKGLSYFGRKLLYKACGGTLSEDEKNKLVKYLRRLGFTKSDFEAIGINMGAK